MKRLNCKEIFLFLIYLEETRLNAIRNQITILNITINTNKIKDSSSDIINILCTHILTMFTNLKCLKFYPYSDIHVESIERLSFRRMESPTFISTNLIELHINVAQLTECHYLLDGRFENLHTLFVNVHLGVFSSPELLNQVTYLNN